MDEKTQEMWQNFVSDIDKATQRGPFKFLAKGDNNIRLVLAEANRKDPTSFSTQTYQLYNGKQNKRFLVFAIVKSLGPKITPDDEFYNVHPVVIPTRARRELANNLARGFELFHPENGHAVTIVKAGEGIQTSYSVIMSPQPYPVDYNKLVWPEMSLDEFGVKFAQDSEERSKNSPAGQVTNQEASLSDEKKAAGW